METLANNQPAAGNAGIASQLTIGHHWPGVREFTSEVIHEHQPTESKPHVCSGKN